MPKGQVTIPVSFRNQLDLKPGDTIEFIKENGNIVLKKNIEKKVFKKYISYLENGDTTDKILKKIRGED